MQALTQLWGPWINDEREAANDMPNTTECKNNNAFSSPPSLNWVIYMKSFQLIHAIILSAFLYYLEEMQVRLI